MPVTSWLELTTFSDDSSNSGGFSWSNASNAASQDDTGADCTFSGFYAPGSKSHYLKGLQISGLDTTGWTSISKIEVRVRTKATANGDDDVYTQALRMVIGGSVDTQDVATSNPGNTTGYETSYNFLEYEFTTGLPTISELGASDFGIAYAVASDALAVGLTASVDSVLVRVTYSATTVDPIETEGDVPAQDVRTPTNIGNCQYIFNSSYCGFIGLDIASSDKSPYCWGEVDRPRYHYSQYVCSDGSQGCPSSEIILNPNGQDPAGFELPGVIQFFNLSTFGVTELREHSAITFHWDSTGHLVWVEKTNYEGDIALSLLWEKDDPYDTPAKEEFINISSCPINPATDIIVNLPSSSPLFPSAGGFVRCFSLLGDYYRASSFFIDRDCSFTAKNYYGKAEITNCSGDLISTEDITLTAHAREMVMEFDSAGLLCRVYFGDTTSCGDIPCVWDRDNPPNDIEGNETAGVIVPVLKLFNGQCGDINTDLEVWLIHFRSTGHYMKSCLYASLCGCTITTTRDEGDTPACICSEYACVFTGNCLRPENPGYCPDMVIFSCEEAASNAGNCVSEVEPAYCVYSYNNNCCTPQTGIPSSYITPEDPSSSESEYCEFIGDNGACTA